MQEVSSRKCKKYPVESARSWSDGGRNVAPELAEVGSVIKREGFAVGAAAADAARGPGGGAIVLLDGIDDLAPKHAKPRKCGKNRFSVKL